MISQGPHGPELLFFCGEHISPGNVYSGAVEGSEVMAESLAKILPGSASASSRVRWSGAILQMPEPDHESNVHEDSMNYHWRPVGPANPDNAFLPQEIGCLFSLSLLHGSTRLNSKFL